MANSHIRSGFNNSMTTRISQVSYGTLHSSSTGNLISKDGGAYEMGELDQAYSLYLRGEDQGSGPKPPTLNIFPSQPMHVEPSSTRGGTLQSSPLCVPLESSMELANRRKEAVRSGPGPGPGTSSAPAPAKAMKGEVNRKSPTSSSEQEGPKTPNPKILRRLAQNREAARKSRLRKKAYIQQLESSRIRLTQLEHELERARGQGVFFGGGGGALLAGEQGIISASHGNISAAMFDMEYARWLEENHRLTCELRAAVQEHLPENELQIFVDNCLTHYNVIMNLKIIVAKSDVFHLVSGTWNTLAERCFLWIGGFRPTHLIKIVTGQIEPLTEQQIMGICALQQSTQEAEEALSQGLEALYQSLSENIISDSLSSHANMANFMNQMALAMDKLSAIEGFVRQAENLRHQTLHGLHQMLTTRQAARSLLAIAEYFHRLRALSSLWLVRTRHE